MRDGHAGRRVHARRPRARIADLLPAQCNVPGHSGDAVARALGDALDGLGDFAGAVGGVVGALFFDIEVLGVLADNDEVDGAFSRGCRFHGAHVGVEVEFLAERDDGGRVAGDFGGGGTDGAEEGAVALCL